MSEMLLSGSRASMPSGRGSPVLTASKVADQERHYRQTDGVSWRRTDCRNVDGGMLSSMAISRSNSGRCSVTRSCVKRSESAGLAGCVVRAAGAISTSELTVTAPCQCGTEPVSGDLKQLNSGFTKFCRRSGVRFPLNWRYCLLPWIMADIPCGPKGYPALMLPRSDRTPLKFCGNLEQLLAGMDRDVSGIFAVGTRLSTAR